jgi:hypothetical protein
MVATHTGVMKLALAVIVLAGCGEAQLISHTQLVYAPARAPTCSLELLQGGTGATWQLLGYVVLYDRALQDPTTHDNLALIRPRACELGGTAVSVATSYVHTDEDGDRYGSTIEYLVLRPLPAAQLPTAF